MIAERKLLCACEREHKPVHPYHILRFYYSDGLISGDVSQCLRSAAGSPIAAEFGCQWLTRRLFDPATRPLVINKSLKS
jgi:hypothetical protein